MSDSNRPSSYGNIDTPHILAAGGTIFSAELDLADDDGWFREHPGAIERRRLATAPELAMSGRLPGTMVRIRQIAPGFTARIFPRRSSSQN